MTDITELAQREKFEAWVITQICISKITLEGLRTPDGYRNSTLSGRDYNLMWNLWKAAGAELVEALESEKRICATWRKTAEANSEKLEKAQKRISRLESRSVKLPKAMSIEGGAYCSAHAHYDSDGDYYDRADVEEMLSVAGIKVETE